MKLVSLVASVCAMLLFVVSCDGDKTTKNDKDVVTGDDDLIITDELGTDEGEPEGEEEIKDDGSIVKDDGPIVKDDSPVVTDDATIEPDDATVEPDDATVESDDATVEPDDATVESDDATVEPDDATVESDDATVEPDETVTDNAVPDEDTTPAYTIGWCNLQWPVDLTITEGETLGDFYGRVYIAGLTDQTTGIDTMSSLRAQFGWGAAGSSAEMWGDWVDATGNPDNANAPEIGNNDEYIATITTTLSAGLYDYTFRFSVDAGATWTYCNANRSPLYNGTNAENPYDPAKNGHLTVEASGTPCNPNPCTEPYKTVCTVTETEPFYVCSCDSDAHDDGTGNCIPNVRFVPCENTKPLYSQWVDTGPYTGAGTLLQTWDGDSWEPAADTCPWECNEGYHWNDGEGACLETLVIGWCNTQWPTDASWYRGEVVTVYGRVYVDGLTDLTTEVDTAPQLIVQIGSGEAGTSATDWLYWGPMEPNPDNELAPGIGDNDEYLYNGPVSEALGDWDFVVRVSGDSGATWTYCNANREATEGYNGTDSAHPYDPLKNGHFTVTSPCDEGVCNEPNKSVCADSDEAPFYTCSCDDDAHDDGSGNCIPNIQTVSCTNPLPTDAMWVETGVYDGVGHLTQTWDGDSWEPAADTCPWECPVDTHYAASSNSCVPNTIGRLCTNPLPQNAHWVAIGPYGGTGALTQTWVGPDEDDWTPPTDSCPWECNDGYHWNDGEGACLETLVVGWCNTQWPLNIVGKRNTTVTVYGQLWIEGVTEFSVIDNGTHTITPYLPQVKAQLGAGPRDSDPTTWGDRWMDAIPNIDMGNNDEYMAEPILDMPGGLYDYAYRFSGDSGNTWTYCDSSGSNDGYQIADAGKLTVYECDSSADCVYEEGKEICVTDSNDPLYQMCVECLSDDDCVASGKVCDEPNYTCKLPGKLVINEVDYDQPGTDFNEFLEILNVGEMPFDLTTATLELVNGSGGAVYATKLLSENAQLATELSPGQYLIYGAATVTSVAPVGCLTITASLAQDNIQNGAPDGVRIIVSATLADGVHYEGTMAGVGEGTSAPTDTGANPDQSIGRCPNGADTDDNGIDFVVMPSTPGAPNTCP